MKWHEVASNYNVVVIQIAVKRLSKFLIWECQVHVGAIKEIAHKVYTVLSYSCNFDSTKI